MEITQLANVSALMLTPHPALAQQIKVLYPYANSKPLRQWLHECWSKLENKPTLLTEFQERQIWHNIIEHTMRGRTVLNIPVTAKLAQQAWQLYRKWQLPPFTKHSYFTEEVNQFSEWVGIFRTYCETQRIISSTEIIPNLSAAQEQFDWPAEIILLNFDNINTQIKQFLEKLPSKIRFITLQETAVVKCIAFADVQTELYAMAQWAKQQSQLNPIPKIQCVVANLIARRLEVQRVFRAVNIAAFNIMSTIPLKQIAMINTALFLLNLNVIHNTINQLTQLLLSRFIHSADREMHSRARLDLHLREMDLPLVRWQTLFIATDSIKNPYLVAALEQYLKQRKKLAGQQHNLMMWRDIFNSLLASLGWPGDQLLNSEEIQHAQSWRDLLDKFVTLPIMEEKITYQAAINLLEQLAQGSDFNWETINAPVQVMDIREAATLPCDVRWVAGMHAQAWPGAVQANPFLPYHWQTEYQLPHSHAKHELAFAKRLTLRLSSSAKQVIFSYPMHNNDQQLAISPLLKNFFHEISTPLTIIDLAATLFATRNINRVLDHAPRLNDHEKLALRGGSALLRAQAACPFQAFARYRLIAKPLADPAFNLTPNQRGQLLHQALAIIWQRLQSQATLLAMQEDQLKQLIEQSVRDAMKKNTLLLQKFSSTWRTLEELCLIRLLVVWLAEEKKRPPFTVSAQEKKQLHEIGGLRLSLILDRIDKLADGSQIVIDYKTGAQNLSISNWSGERPKDPQLPLYCLAYPAIRGSIIAQVRTRNAKLIGITAHASGIAGVIDADWKNITDAWSIVLTQLAKQFAAGSAVVDPRDKEVCNYCDLPSLCRIQEPQETTL